MQSPHRITNRRSWLTDLVYLTLFFSLFYLIWLGSYPLFTPDEGRYSEVAREMVATHDYITPRVNGVAFLDKPVLYYWLQATAIHAFGLNEWALRFFPAMLGVCGALITYVCGRLLFNRRTGLLSAIILATTPLYFGGAHYADLDLEVAVLISASLLFFITGITLTNKFRDLFLYAAYVFSGLAFLTKGMIGIAFPIMIIGAWIIISSRWNTLKHMRLITGLLLFFAITLPWYVLVQRANPEFLQFFFVTQQVTRFLSSADFNNPLPVWFYVPIILIGFFPWTIFLFQAMKKACNTVWLSRKNHPKELYLLLWFFIILLFFSIPHSKIIGYIFPVFPPIALLTGLYLDGLFTTNIGKKGSHQFVLGLVIVSVIFLLGVVYNAHYYNQKTIKPLALQINALIKPQEEVATYLRYYQDLPLYLERRVTMVADWDSTEINHKDNWIREFSLGRTYQNTNAWLINEKTFWQRFNSHERMFVIVSVNDFDKFKLHAKHYVVLSTANKVMLISNR